MSKAKVGMRDIPRIVRFLLPGIKLDPGSGQAEHRLCFERELTQHFPPVGHLETAEFESGGHHAPHETPMAAFGDLRTEPLAGGDHGLIEAALDRTQAADLLTAVFHQHMNFQGGARMPIPQFLCIEAVEAGDLWSFEEIKDGGERRPLPMLGGPDHLGGPMSFAEPSAFRMRFQLQFPYEVGDFWGSRVPYHV